MANEEPIVDVRLVEKEAIKELMRQLRAIDPELAKQLNKDIKAEFDPIRNSIQGSMPEQAPLSGFNKNYWISWAKPRITTSVTPGASWGKSFIAFKYNAANGNAIIELAGRGKRDYVKTTQGAALIRNLDRLAPSRPKQGRIFFQAYMKHRQQMYYRTQKIIDKYVDIANEAFKNG